MKTSHILLAVVAFVTLTGMIATNVLLKQEYNKLDWSNPYQQFERRVVPVARHVVIEGAPTSEIIVESGSDSAQALLIPSMANSFHSRRQGDTLFVSFTMNYDGQSRDPHDNIGYELPTGMLLRLHDLQSLAITNSRLTVRNVRSENLSLTLQNTRLRTSKLAVSNTFTLTAKQNSFALLENDRYTALQTIIQDSSGVQINDSQIDSFSKELSPKAEIQLRGQALKWIK